MDKNQFETTTITYDTILEFLDNGYTLQESLDNTCLRLGKDCLKPIIETKCSPGKHVGDKILCKTVDCVLCDGGEGYYFKCTKCSNWAHQCPKCGVCLKYMDKEAKHQRTFTEHKKSCKN
jgi:hypothetical protein